MLWIYTFCLKIIHIVSQMGKKMSCFKGIVLEDHSHCFQCILWLCELIIFFSLFFFFFFLLFCLLCTPSAITSSLDIYRLKQNCFVNMKWVTTPFLVCVYVKHCPSVLSFRFPFLQKIFISDSIAFMSMYWQLPQTWIVWCLFLFPSCFSPVVFWTTVKK